MRLSTRPLMPYADEPRKPSLLPWLLAFFCPLLYFVLDQRIRVMLCSVDRRLYCKHHTCAPSVPTTPVNLAASRGLTAISSVYNLFTRDPRKRRNS